MKKILTFLLAAAFSAAILHAEDRPVTFDKLPAGAKAFIADNYPDDKVSYVTEDDDLICPEYDVVLASGVRIQFSNSGALEKIGSAAGVPAALLPVQIRDYISVHYPGLTVVEYEIGRKTYEVKLSNHLELKFNNRFALVEIDD